MTHPIITDLINLINQICILKESGVNIVHEACPTDLSWVWKNADTGKVFDTVKLSRVKTIAHLHQSDPRIMYLLDFVIGGDAFIARDGINKLDKLKAFW